MLARSPKKIPANSCPEGKGLAASVCLGDWGWEVDWRNPGMLRAYLLHPPIFIWSPPWILPGRPLFQRPEAHTAARRQVDEWPWTQWTWESWPRNWKWDRWAPPVFRAGSCQGSRSSSSSASGWEEAETRMAAVAELGLTSSWYPTSFCYCKHLGGSIPSTSAEAWKCILRWGQKRGPWIWEVCLSGLGSFLRVQSGVWLWLQPLALEDVPPRWVRWVPPHGAFPLCQCPYSRAAGFLQTEPLGRPLQKQLCLL